MAQSLLLSPINRFIRLKYFERAAKSQMIHHSISNSEVPSFNTAKVKTNDNSVCSGQIKAIDVRLSFVQDFRRSERRGWWVMLFNGMNNGMDMTENVVNASVYLIHSNPARICLMILIANMSISKIRQTVFLRACVDYQGLSCLYANAQALMLKFCHIDKISTSSCVFACWRIAIWQNFNTNCRQIRQKDIP